MTSPVEPFSDDFMKEVGIAIHEAEELIHTLDSDEAAQLSARYEPFKEIVDKYEDFAANVSKIEEEIDRLDDQIEELRRGTTERVSKGKMDRAELERRLSALRAERIAQMPQMILIRNK